MVAHDVYDIENVGKTRKNMIILQRPHEEAVEDVNDTQHDLDSEGGRKHQGLKAGNPQFRAMKSSGP